MNGSDRLRERVNGGMYAMLEFGANDHAEVFLLAAELGDALRSHLAGNCSRRTVRLLCACDVCRAQHEALARLDAWEQE